jgi:hypothetical protein
VKVCVNADFSVGVIVGPNGNRGDYVVSFPGHSGHFPAYFGFPIDGTFAPGDQVVLMTLTPGQVPVILGRANSQQIVGPTLTLSNPAPRAK